jgi:SAM-dependent methyltransferase
MTNINYYFGILERFITSLGNEINHRIINNMDNYPLCLKYRNTFFDKRGNVNKLALHGYMSRLLPLLDIISSSSRPNKILDAGCGCGTESLLMSSFGANVTGIDIVPYKIAFAQSRTPFYKATLANDLRVQFMHGNILQYLKEEGKHFELLLFFESISHIHPFEELLNTTCTTLRQGSKLIISDSNAFNFISFIRTARIRKSWHWYVHRGINLEGYSGQDNVAEERIFTVFKIQKMLQKAGFSIEHVSTAGFLGTYCLPRKLIQNALLTDCLIKFQNVMQKIPILKYLGSNYTIVAIKN